MTISFVLAMSKNRAIGVAGHLPWGVPTDMKRFWTLTKNHPIVMGSKTFESMPGGKALPNRTNIVLTRDPNKQYEGTHTFTDIGTAIRFAMTQTGGDEVMVIGGGKVFAELLPLASHIYLTVIDAEIPNADTFFPELDSVRWSVEEESRFSKDSKNQYGGIFYVYNRTNQYPVTEPSTGRNEEYRLQLQKILENGKCPFCPGGETVKEQPILYKTDHWFIKENAWPLEKSLFHFLITPNRHMTTVDDLTGGEWEDFKKARRWINDQYGLTGDAMYVRSGEPLVTGATVSHLHFHLIEPAGLVQVNFGLFKQG